MPNIKRGMMGAAGAVSAAGSLWGWGRNASGALGLGDTTNRSSPVQVGDLTDWTDVAASGYNAAGFAIKSDGSLWSWGDNTYGELGNGNTTDSSSPVQVGSLTNWFQVEAGQSHVIAIKTDGTLWAWGRNNYGQLGLGSTTDYSSPVQVGSLADWKGNTSADLTAGTPIKVQAGKDISIVIKDDGTIWVWGYGGRGALGDGDEYSRSSPVQLGSLTDWLSVQGPSRNDPTTFAVKTGGTLWAWGNNEQGQLGQGTSGVASASSPVQIGALTTWNGNLATPGDSGMAVKTDGTLWAWGQGSSGQLGLGSTTSYSSPVQVGSLTDWGVITSGYNYMRVIKTDGTLWTWGLNSPYGTLGNGTTTNSSSPVQVGSLTSWGKIMRGNASSCTIALQFN